MHTVLPTYRVNIVSASVAVPFPSVLGTFKGGTHTNTGTARRSYIIEIASGRFNEVQATGPWHQA